MPIDAYRKANRDNWDERVGIHLRSDAYAVDRFIRDPNDISEVVAFDREVLGDVCDKTLIHLQCHFGRDTLSWARLGADVTGVDFSEAAIEAAQKLSRDCGTPGTFALSELYDAPSAVDQTFDIVYTSVGALCWLPDIREWARIAAGFLKPGGVFYVRDGHPVLNALDLDRDDGKLVLTYPYFDRPDPQHYHAEHTYTGNERLSNTLNYEWSHGLGEIVTSLIDAGLRIEFLREHTFLDWCAMPCMVRGDDGYYRMPSEQESVVPLQFSIQAVKPV